MNSLKQRIEGECPAFRHDKLAVEHKSFSDAALALLQPPRENSVLVACPLLIEAQLLRHHGTASSGNHPTSARTATPFQQARRPPTSPPSAATVA